MSEKYNYLLPAKNIAVGVMFGEITLQNFISKIFEIANQPTPTLNAYVSIPFRVQAQASWSPTLTQTWIKGMVFIQNADYEFEEIGSILAFTASDFFCGKILHKNSVPYINWINLGKETN